MFLSRALVAAALLLPVHASVYQDEEHDRPRKKAMISVEKGFKCKGCGTLTKKSKECEGGMKMDFAAPALPTDIVWNVAEAVHDHLNENWIPDVEELLPSEEIMEEMMAMDDSSRLGLSHTVEFGGKAGVEWGCKVTFSMEKGELKKHAECGFKGKAGAGKKTPEEETDEMIM